jgi:hypothetical protein
MGNDSLFYFFMGFSIAIFVYMRATNAAAKRFEFEVARKEYKRQKMLARIAGRFNDFEIKPEFEEEEE